MATVEVRDTSIWLKHLHGDSELVGTLEKLAGGGTVRLRVAGKTGLWEKMKDGPRGATAGLKPIGEARQQWDALYPARRGDLVEVELAHDAPEAWADASDVERAAAWTAFKALTKAGWTSEATTTTRDDLHER